MLINVKERTDKQITNMLLLVDQANGKRKSKVVKIRELKGEQYFVDPPGVTMLFKVSLSIRKKCPQDIQEKLKEVLKSSSQSN